MIAFDKETYEIPRRPEPMRFSVRVVSDHWRDRHWHYKYPDERYREHEHLKRLAARELAEQIFKNCQLFEVFEIQDFEFGGSVLEMELTVSDRGSYENYTKVAEAKGREDGRIAAVKQMTASLPWGLAEAATEYYE